MLKLAIGLSLLALLLVTVDIESLLPLYKQSIPGWVLVSLVAAFVSFFFNAMFLKLVAKPLATLPIMPVFKLVLIGRFFSLFLPSSIGGDIIKGIFLHPYFRSKSDAFSAVIVQRALGGAGTLIVACSAALAFLPPTISDDLNAALRIGAAAGVLILIFLIIFHCRIRSSIKTLSDNFNNTRVGNFTFLLLKEILFYRKRPKALAAGLGMAVLACLIPVSMYLIAAVTLQVDLTFRQALVAGTTAMLAVLLPVTPGGIGVSEGAFVLIAGIMGVPTEHAVAIALYCRALDLLCSLIGGLLYLKTAV